MFDDVFSLCYHHLQILSMIEEAAGTRMYESKRISAQKTIEKKASKLKEINTVSYYMMVCCNNVTYLLRF